MIARALAGVPPRWSRAAVGAAVVAAIAVAHTVLRRHDWRYEWYWAAFQYQLVVLLVAPVLAALAALEAVELRRAAPSIDPSGRAPALSAAVVARLLAIAAVGLAVGAVPVVLVVWSARGVGPPTVAAVATAVPAGAQLLAVLATSYALARWWPRPAVVPILAVGWFGALIGANVVLPERVARVGGASSSLLGLQVPLTVQAVQVLVPVAVAVAALALVWAATTRGTSLAPRMAAVVGPLVLAAAVTGAVAAADGGPPFERRAVERSCVGSGPAWCVADPYRAAVPVLRRRTDPVFEEATAVGATPPERVVQGRARATVDDVLDGNPVVVADAVAYLWLPLDCAPRLRSPLLDDLGVWSGYLQQRIVGARPPATGDEAEALAAAAERIHRCVGR